MARSDRRERRIADRSNKVKTRNVAAIVWIEFMDGTARTVKTPFMGHFVITDSNGEKRLFAQSGAYQRTVRNALAVAKVGERKVRNARIMNPAVAA